MDKHCCACGALMEYEGTRTLYTTDTGKMISSLWSDILTDFVQAEIYSCPRCYKIEFYRPAPAQTMGPVEQAMKNFSHYSDEELTAVLADPDYPEEVKEAARRLLKKQDNNT